MFFCVYIPSIENTTVKIQLSKYSSTQNQIRSALHCQHPTPLEAITAFFKDDLRFEKKTESSLRYSDAISEVKTFTYCSHKIQHISHAHTRRDSQICLKSTTFMGEITTINVPDFHLSDTDKNKNTSIITR